MRVQQVLREVTGVGLRRMAQVCTKLDLPDGSMIDIQMLYGGKLIIDLYPSTSSVLFPAEANGPGLTGSFDKAGPGGDCDVTRVTDEGAMCFMSFALTTNA